MAKDTTPIIQIKTGQLQGLWEEKNQIAVFKGIPYAQPPVGPLRWRPPQPVEPWSGVREATKFSPTAWQRLVDFEIFIQRLLEGYGWNPVRLAVIKALMKFAPTPNQSEDCLYLNIRTPSLDSDAKLPVMVWLHGGDHQDGSASDPLYVSNLLAHKGVVYVSINYRLGLMGYLAHPELTAESEQGVSGNYGTLDQIAALQWVQENIDQFGGDPDNVTIFGESAGGESVAHMMTSPLATGLFHKAIMQSPGNGGQMIHLSDPFLDYPSGEEHGRLFAETLAIYGEGSIEKLRLIEATELYTHMRKEVRLGCFYPLIDGHVLPQSPFSAFHAGQQAKVPVMVGSNADEGTLIHPVITDRHRRAAEGTTATFFYDEQLDETEHLLQFYPGLDQQDNQAEVNFLGDEMFGAKARLYAGCAANGGQPTYLYFFNRVPPNAKQRVGAYHASELSFIFGNSLPIMPHSSEEKALSKAMSNYWTNFAKQGDPNCGDPNYAEELQWPTFSDDAPNWMLFEPAKCRVEAVTREAQYQLLNQRTLRQIEQMRKL